MRAVVLAGGRGTRLAPYTVIFPKPLLPIGELPVIEIILRQLRSHGIDEALISVGYLSELIQAYFTTRRGVPGLEIGFLHEPSPLGTAGPIGLVGGDDDLLVMNGDILTTLDFGDLLAFHRRERPALTVAVRSQEVTFDYGVLEIGDDATVTAYIEKPTTQYKCSMGIYVYSPEAIRAIVPGEPLDVPALVRRLLDRGERVAAYHSDPYWLDVGHRENLEQAIEDFPRMRAALLPDESPDASGVADEPLARDRSAGGAC